MKLLKTLFILQIFGTVIIFAQDFKSVSKFFDSGIKISAVNDSIDVDPFSFFPTQVGDFWQYSTAGDIINNKTVTKDSLLDDGSRLIFYNNEEQWPTYRIDTNYNVFFLPFHQRGNDLLYKLDADVGDRWWIERDSVEGEFVQGYIGEIDTIYGGYYLGKQTVFKVITKYLVYNNNGDIEEYWDSDRVLASGIGLIYEDKDGVRPDILIAAIIDGDTLGTIVGIKEKTSGVLTTVFSLSQNYPNPFNSSTSIEYSILEPGNYKLIILNVLGEIVKLITKNHYMAGTYKIDVDFSDLPSGVYYYKLSTDSFSRVRKMLLLK